MGILAAIGSALVLFGSNWLILLAVVGCGIACLALLLFFLQRQRTDALAYTVNDLNIQVAQLQETTERHGKDLEVLEKVTNRARWATEKLNSCCSSSPSCDNVTQWPIRTARLVRERTPFGKLEPAVMDCCQELLSPADYRLVLYYGNNERLEPLWPVRWTSDPPIYTMAREGAANELILPQLFRILRDPPGGAYIQDVDHPSPEEIPLLDAVSDRHHYKYFACYAICTMPSGLGSSAGARDIVGAFVLQVAQPGPLKGALQDQFFPLLTNVLAAGYLASAAFISGDELKEASL